MSDTAIRRLTTATVLLVAAIAAVVSYQHLYHLAITHGETRLDATLLPLSIDGTVVTASLVMLRAARAGLPTPWLARAMLAAAVAMTVAANVAYGWQFAAWGVLMAGWPAAAFLGNAETTIGFGRKTNSHNRGRENSAPVPEGVPAVPGALPAEAEPFAAELAHGYVPSIRRIRSVLHVGQPKAKEIQAHLETLTPAGQRIRRIRDEIRQGAPVPQDPPAGGMATPAPAPAGAALNGHQTAEGR